MNLSDVKCPECGHSLEDHFNTLIAGDECRESGCLCDKSREEILLAALNVKQAELDTMKKLNVESVGYNVCPSCGKAFPEGTPHFCVGRQYHGQAQSYGGKNE